MALPAALTPFVHAPLRSAFISDFDGTIAPIVDDPARAAPLPQAVDALRALVRRLGLVAVVSGRPVAFLRERLPIDGVQLVGQYGLEVLVGDDVRLDPDAAQYVDAVAAAARDAEDRWPALLIERKGSIAFTVHWRTAPGSEPAPDDLAALAAGHGLVMQSGRMACEFRTPLPVDKGTALQNLDLNENAAFAGDDDGDLAAFRAVTTPRLVRIAVRSPESPPALLEEADLVVEGPPGMARLLTDLADALSQQP